MKNIERIQEEIKEAAMRFREVVDGNGARSFLFVMIPGTVQRFYDSNLWPGDPAFHYLEQATIIDKTLKQELDRWKHQVLGNHMTFFVVCSNNLELEGFLEPNKRYCVVSVLRAVDGFCFILTDEFGKHVKPPEGHAGFHSSRFCQDFATICNN